MVPLFWKVRLNTAISRSYLTESLQVPYGIAYILQQMVVFLEMFKQDSAAGRGQYADSYYESPADGEEYPGYVSLAIQLVGRDLLGYDVADRYDGTVNEVRREHYIKLETTGIAETNPGASAEDLAPVLLCKWGQPILYFRAKPGTTVRSGIRNIYESDDNLLDVDDLDETSFTGCLDHSGDDLVDINADYDFFYELIENQSVTAAEVPYNVESFILWSAGKDGEYGTDDDIKNF